MNEKWFPRLVAAIAADGRSLRDISRAAGFGPNYIQQLIKQEKMPTAPKLFAILEKLGEASTFYVLTGIEMRPEDEGIIREVLELTPDQRQKMMALIASIRASAA